MNRLILIASALLLAGCAASYKPIGPENLALPAESEAGGITMLYQYDVLETSRNKKYAKKEVPRGLRVVAVEVTNGTGRPLTFNRDIALYAGDEKADLLPPDVIRHELRQQGGWYMFWSFFWLVFTKCENDDCSVVPLPAGVVIGLINLGKASGANQNFLLELSRYNLLNRKIAPGETVHGLVGIRTMHEDPLSIRLAD